MSAAFLKWRVGAADTSGVTHTRQVSRFRPVAGSSGFTLVELMVVMSIGGILASLGAFGFTNWQHTSQQRGSAQELVSRLRNTAELATSEGRTHCVDIDPAARSYTVWRYACNAGTGSQVSGTVKTQSARVTLAPTLTLPSPAPACPASHSCLYFYPRGTAIPATIRVLSTARAKVFTVRVEGLTARVYL